jgi:hypothetical protein
LHALGTTEAQAAQTFPPAKPEAQAAPTTTAALVRRRALPVREILTELQVAAAAHSLAAAVLLATERLAVLAKNGAPARHTGRVAAAVPEGVRRALSVRAEMVACMAAAAVRLAAQAPLMAAERKGSSSSHIRRRGINEGRGQSVTPEETLSRERVELMIINAIQAVERKQEDRHNEFMKEMKPISTWVTQQMGVSEWKRWSIPIIVSVLCILYEVSKK